jgi:pimeloyl-ACP methyl ester carboxylesterase
MEFAEVNGVRLAYEVTGGGFPLIWAHEYGGSMESWRAQVQFFARRYKVITFNARGYPPSDVPPSVDDYSPEQAVDDVYELLRGLGISSAHIGGLSMGGGTALRFGLKYPQVARSVIIASAGSGSDDPTRFRQEQAERSAWLEREGDAALKSYPWGPTRLTLKRKDPIGWEQFLNQFVRHSATGLALTSRGVQAKRLPLYDYEADLKKLSIPALILLGDEDMPCLDVGMFLKRAIPRSGLAVFPQSGHAINLEEPELFNRTVLDFLTSVESGNWQLQERLRESAGLAAGTAAS